MSESEALIGGITKGKAFPSEVLCQIVARTDGVPLFIEELTKTVLESGKLRETDSHYELTGPLPALVIPSTLHASLLARLDRLGSVKDLEPRTRNRVLGGGWRLRRESFCWARGRSPLSVSAINTPQFGGHSDWREVALDLNFKLGNVLSQFEGFTSRERRECYARASQ